MTVNQAISLVRMYINDPSAQGIFTDANVRSLLGGAVRFLQNEISSIDPRRFATEGQYKWWAANGESYPFNHLTKITESILQWLQISILGDSQLLYTTIDPYPSLDSHKNLLQVDVITNITNNADALAAEISADQGRPTFLVVWEALFTAINTFAQADMTIPALTKTTIQTFCNKLKFYTTQSNAVSHIKYLHGLYYYDGSNYKQLMPISPLDYKNYMNNAGTPEYYFISGAEIYLAPKPSINIRLRMVDEPDMITTLSRLEDTDWTQYLGVTGDNTHIFDNRVPEADNAVLLKAAMLGSIKPVKENSVLMRQYLEELDNLRKAVMRRSKDYHARVREAFDDGDY